MEDAEKQELFLFVKHNKININDSLIIKENSNQIKYKYTRSLFFLGPYEECIVDRFYIDDLYDFKKMKWSYSRLEVNNDSLKWINPDRYKNKSKQPEIKRNEYNSTYLDKIAGYKYFYGSIKSNTLVIKRNKLKKDIPARKK